MIFFFFLSFVQLSIQHFILTKPEGTYTTIEKDLKQCVNLLETVASIVEINDRKNVITILGFEAGNTLFKSIITLVVSVMFTALRYVSVGQV